VPAHGEVIVDGTVGGGGHAELILRELGPTGRLIGIDCDKEAIELAAKQLGPRPNVTLVHENFRHLNEILDSIGIPEVDGLLLDLGVSSFQLQEATRGFSFMAEGPLDMRMDKRQSVTAADIVNTFSEIEIADILKHNGEERDARKIARAIVRERSRKPILTTTELADIVRRSVPHRPGRARIDPATRTFQALRIEVNAELENLAKALEDALPRLKQRGRICIISFHSLEDRIVKRTFARAARGCICPPEFPQCICGRKPFLRILTPRPVRPSREEIAVNPRSRSARLRAAERVASETMH